MVCSNFIVMVGMVISNWHYFAL